MRVYCWPFWWSSGVGGVGGCAGCKVTCAGGGKGGSDLESSNRSWAASVSSLVLIRWWVWVGTGLMSRHEGGWGWMLAKISGGKGVVQIGSVLISSGGITVFKFSTAVAASLLLTPPPAKEWKNVHYVKWKWLSKVNCKTVAHLPNRIYTISLYSLAPLLLSWNMTAGCLLKSGYDDIMEKALQLYSATTVFYNCVS